jgi:YD repeat-containing protein
LNITFRKLGSRLVLALLLLTLARPSSLVAQSNITFQYFYDDLGQLIKVVDSTGVFIDYVYDAVGNIVQIKRGVAPTVGALAIFNFAPQQGSIGDTVTIYGQGFSATLGANTVQFNGTPATAVSATISTLVVIVPAGAMTGPVSVTVGTTTATSSINFTVVPVPVITSMSRKSALFKAVVPLQIKGFNLTGATFSFAPAAVPPAISVSDIFIAPSGTLASMTLMVGSTAGTFVLVGTNAFGSSSLAVSANSRFTVVDPNSTADSTGTGIPDVIKAAFGADPLDPNSVPDILPVPEADSPTFSFLNGTSPAPTGAALIEADSLTVSLLNGTAPPIPANSNLTEADSLTVSLLNGTAPPVPPEVFEADSLTFSLSNNVPQASNRGPAVQTFGAGVAKLERTPPGNAPTSKARVLLNRLVRIALRTASLFALRAHSDSYGFGAEAPATTVHGSSNAEMASKAKLKNKAISILGQPNSEPNW